MLSLRLGYAITGFATGCLFFLSFLLTIPDGKLHLVFCAVGQGDATYIRFPNGRDILIDAGPGPSIIRCLSDHMPFWDRHIDAVILTHPQKDHMGGLRSVFQRYSISTFITSTMFADTESLEKLLTEVKDQGVQRRSMAAGEVVTIGAAKLINANQDLSNPLAQAKTQGVLGASNEKRSSDEENNASLVFMLQYGKFIAVLPGDAVLTDQGSGRGVISLLHHFQKTHIDVLKVPHHGSKNGLTGAFIRTLRTSGTKVYPSPIAVVSVGTNSYGHPSSEILDMLQNARFSNLRTDTCGTISVVTDGSTWSWTGEKRGASCPSS